MALLDDIDRRILYWLQIDAAMPVAELAERAGVSASPCCGGCSGCRSRG